MKTAPLPSAESRHSEAKASFAFGQLPPRFFDDLAKILSELTPEEVSYMALELPPNFSGSFRLQSGFPFVVVVDVCSCVCDVVKPPNEKS